MMAIDSDDNGVIIIGQLFIFENIKKCYLYTFFFINTSNITGVQNPLGNCKNHIKTLKIKVKQSSTTLTKLYIPVCTESVI